MEFNTPPSAPVAACDGLLQFRAAFKALVQFESCFFTFESSWVVPGGSPSVVYSRFVLYGESGKIDYDWTYNGLTYVRDRLEYPWIPIGTRDRYGAPHPFRVRAHAAFRRLPGRERHPGDQLR
jgi:hypothetical protein